MMNKFSFLWLRKCSKIRIEVNPSKTRMGYTSNNSKAKTKATAQNTLNNLNPAPSPRNIQTTTELKQCGKKIQSIFPAAVYQSKF